jgi:hypothetical protein
LKGAENRLNIPQNPRELESSFTCQHPEALPGTSTPFVSGSASAVTIILSGGLPAIHRLLYVAKLH